MTVAWMLLAVAIVIEVAATALLPRSEGFTRPGWSALVLTGYGLAVLLLANVVRTLPVSVTYAIWSGAGTALVAVAGMMFLGEPMDLVKGVGIGCVIAGVVMLNLHSATH